MINNNSKIGEIVPQVSKIKLDVKNSKILSALLEDASVPLSRLSKRVELSKSNVIRRVQIIEKEGLISGYHAFVDVSKMNVKSCLILVKTSFTENDKEAYIKGLLETEEIYSIIETTGSYDIAIAFYHFNDENMNLVLGKILNFSSIRDYRVLEIKTYFPQLDYTRNIFHGQKQFKINNDTQSRRLDQLDIKILEKLSENCRKSTVDIAQELKSNRETISYRIKRLVKEEIIAKFQPTINLYILGFEGYFLTIKLKNPKEKPNLVIYLASTMRCNTILKSHDGIMGFIHFKTNKEFRDFEENLVKKFSNSILEYDFELIKKQYKLDWFSKEFAKVLFDKQNN
jgi:Lrp/AsnC family transcriptional regulator, leucine-responsive regulatory protein